MSISISENEHSLYPLDVRRRLEARVHSSCSTFPVARSIVRSFRSLDRSCVRLFLSDFLFPAPRPMSPCGGPCPLAFSNLLLPRSPRNGQREMEFRRLRARGRGHVAAHKGLNERDGGTEGRRDGGRTSR